MVSSARTTLGCHAAVQFQGEDVVAVMDQIPISGLVPQCLTQLLARPECARMGRHVAVNEPPAAMLHHHQHVQEAQSTGNGDEEVARHDRLSMVLEERRPALIPARAPRRCSGKILPNGARGDPKAQLQRISTDASAYSFRHARISELLQIYGVDPLTVAAQTGTSIAMIEKAYLRFIPSAMQEKLAALKG